MRTLDMSPGAKALVRERAKPRRRRAGSEQATLNNMSDREIDAWARANRKQRSISPEQAQEHFDSIQATARHKQMFPRLFMPRYWLQGRGRT